jgi:hypothetical protein
VTYAKPEINALGDAAAVIQSLIKFPPGAFDFDDHFDLHPTYDLDE